MFGIFGIFLQATAGHMLYLALHLESGSFPRPLTAAEEQAVDRAHRIGQTKEVEVVRLLVHDSIEEQVVSMSQAKRKLFDLLITPGESMPTKLSDEDLLKLFEIK